MGPGVPHSVISLQQPECRPVSTVVSGSHFLNRFSMGPTLHASIKHAFWHDVWTNATHDDRDFSIARMLVWQALSMDAGAEWPFQGENLYSLLVMGLVPSLLQSLPFKSHDDKGVPQGEDEPVEDAEDATAARTWLERYDPTEKSAESPNHSQTFLAAVRHEMVGVSQLIVFQLPPSDMEQFQQFWTSARSLFIDEYTRRCEYNRS
jgi:hypothetical protein